MYYTKYRPQKFSEISKPNEVADALSNQVKSGKVGHAYLFIGPRGVGKTTTARILAKALNCTNMKKDGDPCDKCDSCLAIKAGAFLDLIEIDAASNRGIDDIRDLREKINLAPTSGEKKIYIIDEVHMLTTEAFNALLKTLEEPPEHAIFILCTTEDHKVPETIKSRCQIFKFKRATVDQIVEKLEMICAEERVKTKFKKEDLEKIARAAMGGFRDAETLLQQVIEGELDIESFVGVGSKQIFINFVDSIEECDINLALRVIDNAYQDGVDLHAWTLELLKYLRDLLFIAANAHEGLIDVPEETFAFMEKQAKKLTSGEVVTMIEVFIRAQNEIKNSVVSSLPLELAVVKLCEVGHAPQKISPTKSEKVTKAKIEKSNGKVKTSLKDIESSWEDVLKGVTNQNHGVKALLKASKPISIDGEYLIIEVFYKFHKERLESEKNKRIVEGVLSDLFNEVILLECVLSDERPVPKSKNESGELTDMNVDVPSDITTGDSVLDVFDGSLPI